MPGGPHPGCTLTTESVLASILGLPGGSVPVPFSTDESSDRSASPCAASTKNAEALRAAAGRTKLEPGDYGPAWQKRLLDRHRDSQNNDSRHRITLAHRLVDTYALPRLGDRPRGAIVVVDLGCSIGTFALEYAAAGFRAIGVDFDASALEMAQTLAAERGLEVEWVCEDLTSGLLPVDKVDIAILFDMLEHLKDDEIGALLAALRRRLRPEGSVVFHTYPSQYTYLFAAGSRWSVPLLPLRWLPQEAFTRVSRAYAEMIDAARVLVRGEVLSERREAAIHCNLLTVSRVRGLFERAGFDIVYLDSGELFPNYEGPPTRFRGQPITHRNIYGVAVPGSRRR